MLHSLRIMATGGGFTGNWIVHRDHAAILAKLISTIISSIIKVGIGTQTSKGTRRSEKKTKKEKPRKSRMKGYTTGAVRYWMSEQVSLLANPHSINIQISLKEEMKVNSYWMVLLPLAVRKSQARSKVFSRGGCDPTRWRTKRSQKAQVARGGELGCLRLQYPHIF